MIQHGWQPSPAQQWLEEAWRHGEVVADGDGRLVRPGSAARPTLPQRARRYARRLLGRARPGGRAGLLG